MVDDVGRVDFYDALPRVGVFDDLIDAAHYQAVPDDWLIGVADIANSTAEIAAGRYKTVNMVGAAVISAVMNALDGQEFPFVFGGDGAGFATRPSSRRKVSDAMAAVARWADAEFGINMRVALVPVSDATAAGHAVEVARYQASAGADYAMFSGGGLSWAEEKMKAGAYQIDTAPRGTVPDLTGLSCRWAHMPARHGTIASIVVASASDATPVAIAKVYGEILSLVARLERGGHPAPIDGMGTRWPPKGAGLEAQAQRGNGSFLAAKSKALFESFVAWVLIRTGATLGGFDARRYARVVAENADFRKLDDGLKMTLDCDPDTLEKLEAILSQAQKDGVVRYGIATQSEAMMTCIVPSILTDDHLHFIDGAAGGYTQAATRMKTQS